MILDNAVEVYEPTTLQDKTPVIFEVGSRSQVVYLAPTAGETLSEADSFELRRVIAINPTRSIKEYHLDKTPILLGNTLISWEIMSSGDYIIKKILNTTELVGAYHVAGFEKLT